MKYVAFLRGINIGKTKLIPMGDLKDLFLDMGFLNPKTYLRSGNVVFEAINTAVDKIIDPNNIDIDIDIDSDIKNDTNNDNTSINRNINCDLTDKIADIISKNIKNSFGFDVEVIVKNKDYINSLIENNPYKDNYPIEELYFTIFKDKIDKCLSKKLIEESKAVNTDDKFTIAEKEVYLLCKSKYNKTKFNNNYFESKLDNISTTRNWKTISKIKNMMD